MSIFLSLPIYRYTNKTKTKKMLLGMNQIINLSKHYKNYIKQGYHKIIEEIISGMEIEPINGQYEILITLYYKNTRCDLSNVCSMIEKYVCDALQELGYLEEDNVRFCVRSTYIVAEQDKENPRAEILISEVNNEQ